MPHGKKTDGLWVNTLSPLTRVTHQFMPTHLTHDPLSAMAYGVYLANAFGCAFVYV